MSSSNADKLAQKRARLAELKRKKAEGQATAATATGADAAGASPDKADQKRARLAELKRKKEERAKAPARPPQPQRPAGPANPPPTPAPPAGADPAATAEPEPEPAAPDDPPAPADTPAPAGVDDGGAGAKAGEAAEADAPSMTITEPVEAAPVPAQETPESGGGEQLWSEQEADYQARIAKLEEEVAQLQLHRGRSDSLRLRSNSRASLRGQTESPKPRPSGLSLERTESVKSIASYDVPPSPMPAADSRLYSDLEADLHEAQDTLHAIWDVFTAEHSGAADHEPTAQELLQFTTMHQVRTSPSPTTHHPVSPAHLPARIFISPYRVLAQRRLPKPLPARGLWCESPQCAPDLGWIALAVLHPRA